VHEPLEGVTTTLARVPEDRPITGELLFESVMEGILVSGPVWGVLSVDCARCLRTVESAFRVEVQELYRQDAEGDEDEYPISEERIDLQPMLRDAVMLALPFSPLCRPDCLGLCERCGGDRNLGECRCEAEVDGRWAALSGLVLPDEPMGSGQGRRSPT
jgi:uncharacterized protein